MEEMLKNTKIPSPGDSKNPDFSEFMAHRVNEKKEEEDKENQKISTHQPKIESKSEKVILGEYEKSEPSHINSDHDYLETKCETLPFENERLGEIKNNVKMSEDVGILENVLNKVLTAAFEKQTLQKDEKEEISTPSPPPEIAQKSPSEDVLLAHIRILESKLKTSEDELKNDKIEIQNLREENSHLKDTLDICHSQLKFTEIEMESELDSLTRCKNLKIQHLMAELLEAEDFQKLEKREVHRLRLEMLDVQKENLELKKLVDQKCLEAVKDQRMEMLEAQNAANSLKIQSLERQAKVRDANLAARQHELRLEKLEVENLKNQKIQKRRILEKTDEETGPLEQ